MQIKSDYIKLGSIIFFSIALGTILHVLFVIPNEKPPSSLTLPQEPPPPSPNPAYLEKIRKQPFWEKLPYYSDNFKIDYVDSDKTIVITTFTPYAKTKAYRSEALRWLRINGATISALKIRYEQGVKDHEL